MRKRFIITENEKIEILKKYGLIKEQKKLPHIESGSFTSTDGDKAHNFKQLETKLDQLLPQLYNQGINPKITSVTATIKKRGNQFDTNYSVTIDKSNDGKAWMGFTSRGSFGKNYQERADGQIYGSENEDKKTLKKKLEDIGAVEIDQIKGSPVEDSSVPFKQYFFQFTKNIYPPLKTDGIPETLKNIEVPISNQPSQVTVTGTTLDDLRNRMKEQKNISINPDSFDVDLNSKPKTITFFNGSTKVKSLSFIFDDQGKLSNRLKDIGSPLKNPTMVVGKKNEKGPIQWAVLYFE